MTAVRRPAVAGRFYPGDAATCRRELEGLFGDEAVPAGPGAIVPHAGWVFSGSTAALGISAVAGASPETVVVFGAAHGSDQSIGSVYRGRAWGSLLGEILLDAELIEAVAGQAGIVAAERPHAREHSIEVQVPLIQWRMPAARLVPIVVQPMDGAAEVGAACVAAAERLGRRVGFLGSTDLTHYGPAFGFEPAGSGEEGLRWAKEVNDRRLVALIKALDADGVVRESRRNRNACGGGAVAATIGAMRVLGATEYVELRHTTSAEVRGMGDSENAVGYEAGVFQRPA